MSKIILYDTTLRDGTQGEGISLSVLDKIHIAKKLDEFGIHYIEGGWPGSNPKDMEFFKKIKKEKLKKAVITAFGSTCRPNTSPNKDPNVQALIKSGTKVVTIFGKTWDFHVKYVLKTSQAENLKIIEKTVAYLKKRGLKVIYDAEHFFDGYKNNSAYALSTILAAQRGGCDVITLCETNGGMITSDLVSVIRKIKPLVDVELGIHCHNDIEMAVANSIAAVEEGCTYVQGTINGYGERCGNANLCSIIPNIVSKLGLTCISSKNLSKLTEVSHFIAEVCNMKHADNQPYAGKSAFAHKAGIHVNAIVKHSDTYEHIKPEKVGNKRRFLLSELSGRTNIIVKARELSINLKKDTKQTGKILKILQDMEHQGYQFEAAEGSFEVLMKRAMKKYKRFFELEGFKVGVEKREDGKLISEAAIKVKVGKKQEHTAAEGDGPVNALDSALRKALGKFYPSLSQMHLSDFKVRVLDEKAGTAAKVRVMIESQDASDCWTTIGVSENIIEASWQALVDSIEYKLLKDDALI